MSASRSPGTVVVNNTAKNYTLSGSTIAGTCRLIKQDGGTLTLGSANTYSGATTNSGGTLMVGNATALGTGALTMDGGSLTQVGKQIVLANVAVVATTPPQVSAMFNHQQLQLAWPSDHIGWQLEAQTNSLVTGLGTNWFPVSGSTQTNQVSIPINATNDCVFFRLNL